MRQVSHKHQNASLSVSETKFVCASERLLQQAIAGLLTCLGVRNVQILHGSQEYGKDIIFRITGPLRESMLCACVIKNHKITGAVASSKGARTILLQAEQALDTPHYDGIGNGERIQRVYIITPSQIPPETIASIHFRLRERAGQVIFVGG